MGIMTSYDKINATLFENGETNKYLCSMCGQYTTLDDSISHKGYNLICCKCVWKIRSIMGLDTSSLVLDSVYEKGKLIESLINNV